MIQPVEWLNKTRLAKLIFYPHPSPQDKNKIQLTAELFEKTINKEFIHWGHIPEDNITVEHENTDALKRGILQKVSRLKDLTTNQKKAIMGNLTQRNITIEKLSDSGKLIIHALP
jgi:hypothetical protein